MGGVIVNMLASSAVDRECQPWLGQPKDYKIGICCFSAKNTALRSKNKLVGSEIRIMCPSGASAIKIQLGIIISLKINLFSPWYSWKRVGIKQQSLAH